MRALVYHGAGKKDWESAPDPEIIDPTDAIIRVEAVTICGTDLHILKGDVPEVPDGRVLGHEAVGTVAATGAAVTTVRPGDRVLASCISACGRCRYCREGAYGQCLAGGGWILGHTDQRGAGRVRPHSVRGHLDVPAAGQRPVGRRGHARRHPAHQLRGRCPQRCCRARGHRGDRRRRSHRPGRDHDCQAATRRARSSWSTRPSLARRAPRASAPPDRPGRERPARGDPAVTGGLGADAALEAVGIPATFELCTQLVRPGGHVANVGVHGKPATLHLESLWIRNVTITTGLVDTRTTPTLLRLLAAGQLDVTSLVTHRFRMDDFLDAYEVFADPAHSGALKVLVTAE